MLTEVNVEELNDITTRFFRMFPVNSEVFLNNSECNNLPDQCPIVAKIRKTGINVLVKNKSDHSTCVSCTMNAKCSINTAGFIPILITQRVIGFILITAIKGEEDWFLNNLSKIEHQIDLFSEWISFRLESQEVKQENTLFKEEMNGVFSFIHDSLLLVGQDGIIHNISNKLCGQFNKSKMECIGINITEILSKSDWFKIKDTVNQLDLKISIKKDRLNQKKEQYLAKIKPLLSNGQIVSFIIHLLPILDSKKKIDEKRVLYSFNDVKGTSDSIQSVIDIAKRVAPSDSSVLLRGESGTGKEVFAQSIHQASNRKDSSFIALNCAAIPETLLESELFGHVKGSFTGSNADKPGRFELANQGTIFLDEIGDLSLHLQAKLLRVVQERKIERVGDTKSTPVNVRIITATHRNLEELVSTGQFREDLYYRLNVIPITIPPLRERKEDIPILVEYFLKSFSKQLFRSPKRLSKDVYEILLNHHWTGNIRELQNVVHHFVQLEIGDLVTIKSLPKYLSDFYIEKSLIKPSNQLATENVNKRNRHLEEKDLIIRLLDQFGRDTLGKKKVAKQMKISLPTLYRRINKLNIK